MPSNKTPIISSLTSSQVDSVKRLKQWFLSEKRDLPWRYDPSPYEVWISEIMLQQTQVAVVIPYFERWMQRFPTVQALAVAPLDDVIKMWEGLGYYSRARNLHAGAQMIVDKFHGELPQEEEKLAQIKGLGPYTIGAIRSFAFHQRVPAVDGNVIRVLSRFFCIEDDIAKSKTVNHVRQLATTMLPEEESWIVNEALIELGATICTRKPKCEVCPMRKSCKATLHGKVESLPYNSKKVSIEVLHRSVAIISCEGKLLVRRGEKGQIMSDLHEFPFFEVKENGVQANAVAEHIKSQLGLKVTHLQALSKVNQSFTRYRVHLYPEFFSVEEGIEVPGYRWMDRVALSKAAFSAGHRKIYEAVLMTSTSFE